MVVAQLVELSLPIPEIHGSNPAIGNIIYYQQYWKDENKEKEAGHGPNFKNKKIVLVFEKTEIDVGDGPSKHI